MLHLALAALLLTQEPAPQQATPPDTVTTPTAPAPPKGQVLFERHLEEDKPEAPATPQPALKQHSSATSSSSAQALDGGISDAQRTSVHITGYDLDLHLNHTSGTAETRARITLTNATAAPLTEAMLQISHSLTFQTARENNQPVQFTQHPIETDTDHTGVASEAVFTLAAPLAPGASTTLDLFYSGTLVESTDRLTAIGAPEAQAALSDWDGLNPAQTVSGLRGFGNVLWYPVAEPRALLGEGNQLLSAVASNRAAQAGSPFHLRLTIESATPLTTAFFAAEPQPLVSLDETPNTPETSTLPPSGASHLYTAEWKLAHTGPRTPSLFLTSATAQTPASNLLTAYTDRDNAVILYNNAAVKVQPLMQAWFGASPIAKLSLLDLGTRDALPFEDTTLIALPMRLDASTRIAPAMAQWLTHAFFKADEAWMTEGLALYMQQLWTERELRATRNSSADPVLDEESLRALALSEHDNGAPLTTCTLPICYRTKGAAVWRMLSALTSESELQQALQALHGVPNINAHTFETALEEAHGKSLAWFFEDWVYADRGLPDLSIVNVSTRPVQGTTTSGLGSSPTYGTADRARSTGGYIVAVEVRNEGTAIADVPVTLRASGLTSTERIRVEAHSRATVRILVPALPDSVEVNDGTTPEVASSTHTRTITTTTR